MNIILFEEQEITKDLPLDDPRAVHIISVLRCCPGDEFDAGIINGCRGKGIVRSVSSCALTLDFAFPDQEIKEKLYPVTFTAGLPRPQTARKILQQITSITTSKAERNKHYFKVTLVNVNKSHKLFDIDKITRYLKQIAPIPFNKNKFRFFINITCH